MQQPHPYLRLEPSSPPGESVEGPAPAAASHAVQFYDDQQHLAGIVSDFLGEALMAGTPAILIATPEHAQSITGRLRSRGLNPDALAASGVLSVQDARQILDSVMYRDFPDARRLRDTLEPLLAAAVEKAGNAVPRVYWEVVNLLWKDGNPRAAIRLEELWGSLTDQVGISLLCAYDMEHFSRAAHAKPFERICRVHDQVLPPEQFTLGPEGIRPLEIALLQQRARALDGEVRKRKELERRLRETTASRAKAAENEAAARAEATAASRAKADFLAVVSHELRTPLNAIGGHVQLLELGIHGPLNEAQLAALARVGRSQRHLLSLINDLLNLTRIESGRLEYDLADTALPAIIREVTSTLEPMIAAKSLDYAIETISRSPSPHPLTIHADAEKVRQILVNLLTNAIKFTPAGGRIAVIAEASSSQDDDMVRVHVRDTGIGIRAEAMDTIFEPFVQLGTRIIDRAEGMGLGLAISRELARGMGGDLTVVSVVGEGTTFTLQLPRGTPAVAA